MGTHWSLTINGRRDTLILARTDRLDQGRKSPCTKNQRKMSCIRAVVFVDAFHQLDKSHYGGPYLKKTSDDFFSIWQWAERAWVVLLTRLLSHVT